MYQYTVTNLATQETAIASLDTEDDNTFAELSLEGDAATDLGWEVMGKYGAFGHLFNPASTSAIDLDHILQGLNGWQAKSTGYSKVSSYAPGIPKEALT